MTTNADITLYNYSERDGVYYSSQIKGVNWHGTQASSVNKGLDTADVYSLRIPIHARFGGKRYVPHKQWEALSADEKAKAWTLYEGDIIVQGLVEGDLKQIRKEYETVAITSFTDNRRGSAAAQHWRVMAK